MQAIRHFFKTHRHAWWGLFLPAYLIMFFAVEHLVTDNYWATQTSLDELIPFCEWFIFPYVSWSPLLAVLGIYLILREPEGFRRYIWFLMLTFTTATVFCALVPNGQDLRPALTGQENIAAWLVAYTYSIDTCTNVFPSVHVLGVMGALSAIWNSPTLRKPAIRWGWTAYGLLIIAATVLVKQHAIIDVFAGIGVGLIAYFFVYIVIGGRRDRLMGLKA